MIHVRGDNRECGWRLGRVLLGQGHIIGLLSFQIAFKRRKDTRIVGNACVACGDKPLCLVYDRMAYWLGGPHLAESELSVSVLTSPSSEWKCLRWGSSVKLVCSVHQKDWEAGWEICQAAQVLFCSFHLVREITDGFIVASSSSRLNMQIFTLPH